jgi:hypothetical protein
METFPAPQSMMDQGEATTPTDLQMSARNKTEETEKRKRKNFPGHANPENTVIASSEVLAFVKSSEKQTKHMQHLLQLPVSAITYSIQCLSLNLQASI